MTVTKQQELSKEAALIARSLLVDPSSLPDSMTLDSFKVACATLQNECPHQEGALVIIIDGTGHAQFPAHSPLQCLIENDHPLTADHFRFLDDGAVYEVSKRPPGWLPTIVSEIRLLRWWALICAALSAPLIGLQSTSDIYGYLVIVAQLLGVTFVLFGLVKASSLGDGRAIPRREFLSGNLGKLSNDEWAVGTCAVAAMLLSLLGLLLATPSSADWDARLYIAVAALIIHPVHWLLVAVVTLASVVLVSFYRTLAVYYWQRSGRGALNRAKDRYFTDKYQECQSDTAGRKGQ